MENNQWLIGAGLVFISHLIAAFSQILLKKAAGKTYSVWWRSYVNPQVITAYSLFVVTTILSVLAMKHIPMSVSAALGASGQIIVPVMSFICLREKITKKKLIGMLIIVVGILIFSL